MIRNQGVRIHINGVVQGVGFRPFVYSLAKKQNLNGWVRNTSAGVDIQVDGNEDEINKFIHDLKTDIPPLARIDLFEVETTSSNGFLTFEIKHSEPIPGAYIPISPDVSICDDCLKELMDPNDHRFNYPFINCTNCGPRFTIINDIPYDRPKTTMAMFEMCEYCRKEYNDPLNRRFHAQPVACQDCGPSIWLESSSEIPDLDIFQSSNENLSSYQIISEAQKLILSGKIVAIKGLGGFHLACDATNNDAVTELRHRKLRVDKPFALMMADLGIVKENCEVSDVEEEILLSKERPIVLLKRRSESKISPDIAPRQNTLGVMLPYTPLHHLLFAINQDKTKSDTRAEKFRHIPLVMTSGNISEEPIAYQNHEAKKRLSTLADAFLMHNREIRTRCDDSVLRQTVNITNKEDLFKEKKSKAFFIRRSRGYAPNPIKMDSEIPQILAVGPELKNTFCLTKDDNAFLSHHIGEMENYETLNSFMDGINHFEILFRIQPEAIACDLHPDYLSTRYAFERSQSSNIPLYQIQHHHAHIAACMVDNNLDGHHPILGIAFDGTGYGDDGTIWGGEFLIADYQGYRRFAHLERTPLPGGDAGTKKPLRIALAQLWHKDIEWYDDLPPVQASCSDEMSMLHSMLKNNINTPLTTSMGRLFDSVAALAGIGTEINYDAQAAIEFEAIADPNENDAYSMEISRLNKNNSKMESAQIIISTKLMFQEVVADIQSGIDVSSISGKFHNAIADAVLRVSQMVKNQYGINEVALSGGVWQNMLLLEKCINRLSDAGFIIFIHQQIPPNDGGLSLGQAIIAGKLLSGAKENHTS